MSSRKKSFKIMISLILSILIIVTTLLGSSINTNAASVSGQAIVNEAMNHLGKPYVWGATGPSSFDCSGLTSYVYKKIANIDIGRTTYDQINSGREVSQSELQPGDLVFTHSEHVGIYVGDGKIIHAPQTGDVVKISPIWQFWRARRIIEGSSAPSDPRAENPLFDVIFNASFYSSRYLDLKNAFGSDSAKLGNHFLSNGIREGRMASEVFDVRYYLNHNQDLINAFGASNYETAYKHFLTSGYKEPRDLSPIFNLRTYINNNPDVAKAFGDDHEGIMRHFLTSGMKEGRNASVNFNLEAYKFNYEDLRNAFGDNKQSYYEHYLANGIYENRIANRISFKTATGDLIFNAKFYADKYSDLKQAFGYDEIQLAKHFITCGIKEGRTASEVFDVRYYLNNNPDLIAAFGKDNYQAAYNHFLSNGYMEPRKLSPVFDLGYYIKNNPDVANAYGNNRNGIINHFLVCGMKEGRSSCDNFNLSIYKNNYEDLRNAFRNDNKAYFDHYLDIGINEGRVAK